MTAHSPATQILWAGTVGFDRTVPDYVDAASAAGMSEISVNLDQFAGLEPTGSAVQASTAYAADHGVTVAVLDGLYSWLPLGASRLAARTRSLDDTLALAQTLQAPWINALVVNLGFDAETLAEHFAAACDRAADAGCSVHVEFSPIGGLPTLGMALEMVRLAGRSNGGVLFDTWHFYRGDPDFDTLADVSPGEIVAVQISDAPAEFDGTLWDDTIHHRRLPGDGDIDLDRMMRGLASVGALTRLGPEVISDELHAMSGPEAARVASRGVADLLDRALGTADTGPDGP